ncbi:MAG TPA: diguanylate cyclase, partial [Xanthomonadales bacterium]|nr:diguanylate cyclase [Xanthomonadales bacterium]
RAYLLTGDAAERDRFQQSLAGVSATSAQLEALVPEGGAYAADLARLQQALEVRLARAVQVVAMHDRDGLPAAQAMLSDGVAVRLEQDIRGAIEQLTRGVNTRLVIAEAASAQSSRWLLLSAALGAPLALLALGLGYGVLRREVQSRQIAERDNEQARARLQASVEQLTQMSHDMQRLSAYASLLQTCDSTEEALDVTCVCFAALLPDYSGTVYLLSDDRTQVVATAFWGAPHLVSSERIAPAQCWGWRRAQPYLTDSHSAELRCSHVSGDAEHIATACLPLNAHGMAFGLLYLDGPEPIRSERLAATAAEQLSLALANLRLRDSLRDQSIKDALTGLYNRRHLERALEVEYARCRRAGRPLAVLMIDIDHFKAFNDQHGHAAGDTVLSVVGELLGTSFRAGDTVCRYGGEEFTVILPESDSAAAAALAENVRQAIAALDVVDDGDTLPRVTASIGVASVPGSVETLDGLIEAADRALYLAKSQGRNRVVIAALASAADGEL